MPFRSRSWKVFTIHRGISPRPRGVLKRLGHGQAFLWGETLSQMRDCGQSGRVRRSEYLRTHGYLIDQCISSILDYQVQTMRKQWCPNLLTRCPTNGTFTQSDILSRCRKLRQSCKSLTPPHEGKFSIKLAYHRVKATSTRTWNLQPSSSGITRNDSWFVMWKLKNHPKILKFMWRLNAKDQNWNRLPERGIPPAWFSQTQELEHETDNQQLSPHRWVPPFGQVEAYTETCERMRQLDSQTS